MMLLKVDRLEAVRIVVVDEASPLMYIPQEEALRMESVCVSAPSECETK